MNRVKNSSGQVQRVRTSLRELAYSAGPGVKLPTTRDLCRTLETNTATLHSALDELEADNVIERKHAVGIYVSSLLGRATIAVMLNPSFFHQPNVSPYWGIMLGLLVSEVQQRSRIRNENVTFHLLSNTPEDQLRVPEALVKMVEEERVNALIGIGLDPPVHAWATQTGLPYVSTAGEGTYAVSTNEVVFFQIAVKKLSELGCKRIGVWSSRPIFEENLLIIRELCAAYGLDLDPGLIWPPDTNSSSLKSSLSESMALSSVEQGHKLAMEAFGNSQSHQPDGLIITDDMLTSGAMAAFHKLGLQAGKHIPIVSHSNSGSPILACYRDTLYLVENDPADLVRRMFGMLDELMEGHPPSTGITYISPRLIN